MGDDDFGMQLQGLARAQGVLWMGSVCAGVHGEGSTDDQVTFQVLTKLTRQVGFQSGIRFCRGFIWLASLSIVSCVRVYSASPVYSPVRCRHARDSGDCSGNTNVARRAMVRMMVTIAVCHLVTDRAPPSSPSAPPVVNHSLQCPPPPPQPCLPWQSSLCHPTLPSLVLHLHPFLHPLPANMHGPTVVPRTCPPMKLPLLKRIPPHTHL